MDVWSGAIILLVSVGWGFLASGHPARCHRWNTPTLLLLSSEKHLHFTSTNQRHYGEMSKTLPKVYSSQSCASTSFHRKTFFQDLLESPCGECFCNSWPWWFHLILCRSLCLAASLPGARPIPIPPPSYVLIWNLLRGRGAGMHDGNFESKPSKGRSLLRLIDR